ncbi:MAG TPA: hypothetical protein VF737_04715, partial [Gemmatimonadaceae bacterium]
PLWQPEPVPFATTAGMHRVVFNPMGGFGRGFGGGRGRGRPSGPPQQMNGTFTARLTVNGKTYEQKFDMMPDPREAEL